MKKKFILLLAPMLLALGACAPATSSSSSEEDPYRPDMVTVYFFESAIYFDVKNPFYTYQVELGSKLHAPENDPTSSDPAFNTFKGWSAKPFVMNEEEYWDFENDKIPSYIANLQFYIYGQWDYVA